MKCMNKSIILLFVLIPTGMGYREIGFAVMGFTEKLSSTPTLYKGQPMELLPYRAGCLIQSYVYRTPALCLALGIEKLGRHSSYPQEVVFS